MAFDLKTATPIKQTENNELQTKQFDISTARSIIDPVTTDNLTGYDRYRKQEMDEQIKSAILQPLSSRDLEDIDTNEKQEINALWAGIIPYVKGAAGFFTRPFGVEPFGSTFSPEELAEAKGKHPVANTIGEIVGGVAPFIVAAPIFPQSLLGTILTFGSVSGIGEIGRQQVEESIMTPPGEKFLDLSKQVGKAALLAPIWHFSGGLKFIGRPYGSALTRAGIRGAGAATLSKVFGADLETAFREGGMITALSLMFEAPVLAKTALGRGILKNANRVAAESGLPKVDIKPDVVDAAAMRTSLFKAIKLFAKSMKMKGRVEVKPLPQIQFMQKAKPVDINPQGIPAKVNLTPAAPAPSTRPVGTPEFVLEPTKPIPEAAPKIVPEEVIAEIEKVPEIIKEPQIISDLKEITEKINTLRNEGKPVPDSLIKRQQSIIKSLEGGEVIDIKKAPPSVKKVLGIKPAEFVKVRETTLLKQRIQNIARGAREGKVFALKEIKAVQTDVIKLFKAAKLDIPISIKSIQTQKQLIKALPAIEERIARLVEVIQKQETVREINRIAKAEVDPDYREEIDGILEGFDLKARTEATKNRRQKKADFIERQREEGNLDFLPPDFFTDFGKTTLDEMGLEEVEQLRDQIQVLATVGATKNRLLAARGEKDFQKRINDIVDRMYTRVGTKEQFEGEPGPVVSNQQKGFPERARDIIDNFFAAHRKAEFILRSLDNQEVFEIVQDGINKELIATEKAYAKLKEAFKLISKNLNTMSNKDVTIKDVPVTLTREQMIGVVLNNGNFGNRQRLINGNKFTLEEIQAIEKALKPNERKFVEQIFEIIDEQFPETIEVTKKMVGIKPKKVEGKYFPIVADQELNKQAKFNAAKRDLFQDIFYITFVARGFTKARKGGRAPLDLNVFSVIFRHIDDVIHYNSMAIPIRDMQKIINNPRFTKAVTDIMGEPVYNQFSPWLRDIANPRNLTASSSMDKIFQFLRHNATSAILGHRITVSLLQGGSFTQTINEIGLKDSINGIMQFYKNPRRSIEFVYSKSPFIKNRSQTFDREVKDWLKTQQAQRIIKGKKSWGETLFVMIRGIDFLTTMPSWVGAYEQKLAQTQNVDESVRFADGVVRRTQPTAAMENLSAIMRGSATQKLFTSFMTHFSNMHNQMVSAMDDLKYSKDHALRKSATFARAMWWLWIAPSLLAGWIRSGFKPEDWRKFAQELILYPTAGMFLIRDLMNAIVKGFDFGAPPGLAALRETQLTFQSKSGQKKLKHGVKAIGLFTGKIPTQWVDTVDGFIDLSNEETQDFRRLIWGESAISPIKRGLLAAPKKKKGRRL